MSDSQIPDRKMADLREQLVGYLDGELDGTSSRRVEEALAADPHVREEVWQLERSWQMLDELPRTQVDESFTRSTVEMIALRAEEDLVAVQSEIPRRKRRLAIVAGGLLLVAAAAGFLTIKTLNRRGEESMLRDLPVAEDLDQYRVIQDVEFLRALHSRGFQPTEARHEG